MATKAPIDIGSLIYSDPEMHSGRPCVAGSGVMVRTIAVRHMQGKTVRQILKDWPYLDEARIYAALAYYYANKERIDADLEEDERLGRELAAKYPHGWTRETDPSLNPQ
ncbi:MAG: DUF433 domain-containing protein [Chloroflexi bacterium]|nr:DUF433 domain-containing protein [Chloroflexota bacterium]